MQPLFRWFSVAACLCAVGLGFVATSQAQFTNFYVPAPSGGGGGNAFTLVRHVSKNAQGPTSPGRITTTAADFSTVNLIVAFGYMNVGGTINITDSQSNTWVTIDTGVPAEGYKAAYVASPSVSATQTFTLGDGNFPNEGIVVMGLSCSGTPTLDQHTVSTGGFVTTFNTGSITPTTTNEFIFDYIGHSTTTDTYSINSSQTALDLTTTVTGVADAYELQTTATTRNPLWSGLNSGVGQLVAGIAAFKC